MKENFSPHKLPKLPLVAQELLDKHPRLKPQAVEKYVLDFDPKELDNEVSYTLDEDDHKTLGLIIQEMLHVEDQFGIEGNFAEAALKRIAFEVPPADEADETERFKKIVEILRLWILQNTIEDEETPVKTALKLLAIINAIEHRKKIQLYGNEQARQVVDKNLAFALGSVMVHGNYADLLQEFVLRYTTIVLDREENAKEEYREKQQAIADELTGVLKETDLDLKALAFVGGQYIIDDTKKQIQMLQKKPAIPISHQDLRSIILKHPSARAFLATVEIIIGFQDIEDPERFPKLH